jgi:hypothetical protein
MSQPLWANNSRSEASGRRSESGGMLGEEPPVEGRRRGQREDEPGGETERHWAPRPPKGTYDSAASAAIPTRARSSRR